MADRSRRRCVMRKAAVPDATHYVGYVEDDETPEMIMKKFEELERIKKAGAAGRRAAGSAAATPANSGGGGAASGAMPLSSSAEAAAAAAADGDGVHGTATSSAAAAAAAATAAAAADSGDASDGDGLDDAQLQELFKATSMYNVKSLLGNNEALMDALPRALAQDRGGAASEFGFDSGSEDDLVAELRGFWSDDEQWAKPSRKKDRGSKRARGEGSARGGGSGGGGRGGGGGGRGGLPRGTRTCIVTQYNRDSHAFIRRRMRLVDPDAILQLRVPPPPLPLSWGKAVRPRCWQPAGSGAAAGGDGSIMQAAPRGLLGRPHALPASRNCDPTAATSSSCDHGVGAAAAAAAAGDVGAPAQAASCCRVFSTPDITTFDFQQQLKGQTFQAVLINTDWDAPPPGQQRQQAQAGPGPSSQAAAAAAGGVPSWAGAGRSHGQQQQQQGGGSLASRLAALPIPALCPRGFIMVWANKEHTSAVFKQAAAWGFAYVENLTWVLTAPNHTILALPYPTIRRSHITLYIFRKEGEGRDIELRHQRNPDVVFDCVRAVEGREWDVPPEVFDTIETLLPTGKGLFLELWAPAAAGRAGWTHVAEQQQAEAKA